MMHGPLNVRFVLHSVMCVPTLGTSTLQPSSGYQSPSTHLLQGVITHRHRHEACCAQSFNFIVSPSTAMLRDVPARAGYN